MTRAQLLGTIAGAAFAGLLVGQIARPTAPLPLPKVSAAPAPRAEATQTAPTAPPSAPASEAVRVNVPLSPDDPSLGPADAKVVIVEFSDFQCPFCARAAPVVEQLVDQFKGQVRLVFKDFPLPMHIKSELIHEVGEEARLQGKFWPFYDKAFADQKAAERVDLDRIAAGLGMDVGRLDQALDAGTHRAAVAADLEEGRKLGVHSAPTFFVNGLLVKGAKPASTFQALIEAELER